MGEIDILGIRVVNEQFGTSQSYKSFNGARRLRPGSRLPHVTGSTNGGREQIAAKRENHTCTQIQISNFLTTTNDNSNKPPSTPGSGQFHNVGCTRSKQTCWSNQDLRQVDERGSSSHPKGEEVVPGRRRGATQEGVWMREQRY